MSDAPLIIQGLARLQQEAFGPSGFAVGMASASATFVHHVSGTSWHGSMQAESGMCFMAGERRFSREAWNDWLEECRLLAYRRGAGTWTTAEVAIFPDRPGQLQLFDEERLERDPDGDWYPGEHPSDANVWAEELLHFPRTADNIPEWMWAAFRAEDIAPPLYNPELRTVDWDNRRRPVTDRGTDFTVEPTVIDPSLEPGVFAKISKKLFGA
ncbi:hypothetical protein MOD31_20140 [Paenarthrobacter sp. TYUT067]|uniref:hypothetical protein n=1 Tax=Paenarthrobacter sp. TYUT067 TaxID=2926245 RepID=UPI00202FE195|nr:hypothetical protein [Paenarthrobacter sp. TYUT067]MCM0618340.1 hypothetical protein [Paenarthrobacter sp. TYUT067]